MAHANPPMSGPRCLTLAVSLGGIVWSIAWWRDLYRDPVQGNLTSVLTMSLLTCLLGLAVSIISMRKSTRIPLYWLTAMIMSFVGLLTLMAGVGLYFLAAVLVFLVAAWMLNESGEPTMLHRRGDITRNPRMRPRA